MDRPIKFYCYLFSYSFRLLKTAMEKNINVNSFINNSAVKNVGLNFVLKCNRDLRERRIKRQNGLYFSLSFMNDRQTHKALSSI